MTMRVASLEEVNAIANDASVQKMMGVGDLDFSAAMADDRLVALTHNGFCSLFVWCAPGVYEGHVMARKDSRGRCAIDAGKSAFAYMKEQGARMIWAQPSIANRAAIWYVRQMGMKDHGVGYHSVIGDVRYFATENL